MSNNQNIKINFKLKNVNTFADEVRQHIHIKSYSLSRSQVIWVHRVALIVYVATSQTHMI